MSQWIFNLLRCSFHFYMPNCAFHLFKKLCFFFYQNRSPIDFMTKILFLFELSSVDFEIFAVVHMSLKFCDKVRYYIRFDNREILKKKRAFEISTDNWPVEVEELVLVFFLNRILYTVAINDVLYSNHLRCGTLLLGTTHTPPYPFHSFPLCLPFGFFCWPTPWQSSSRLLVFFTPIPTKQESFLRVKPRSLPLFFPTNLAINPHRVLCVDSDTRALIVRSISAVTILRAYQKNIKKITLFNRFFEFFF